MTRWLIELRPNVYVGRVHARIRDQLWQLACQKAGGGAIVQIWSSPNEQGFSARSWGSPDYFLRDFEGVLLVERLQGTFRPESDIDGEPPDMATRAKK